MRANTVAFYLITVHCLSYVIDSAHGQQVGGKVQGFEHMFNIPYEMDRDESDADLVEVSPNIDKDGNIIIDEDAKNMQRLNSAEKKINKRNAIDYRRTFAEGEISQKDWEENSKKVIKKRGILDSGSIKIPKIPTLPSELPNLPSDLPNLPSDLPDLPSEGLPKPSELPNLPSSDIPSIPDIKSSIPSIPGIKFLNKRDLSKIDVPDIPKVPDIPTDLRADFKVQNIPNEESEISKLPGMRFLHKRQLGNFRLPEIPNIQSLSFPTSGFQFPSLPNLQNILQNTGINLPNNFQGFQGRKRRNLGSVMHEASELPTETDFKLDNFKIPEITPVKRQIIIKTSNDRNSVPFSNVQEPVPGYRNLVNDELSAPRETLVHDYGETHRSENILNLVRKIGDKIKEFIKNLIKESMEPKVIHFDAENDHETKNVDSRKDDHDIYSEEEEENKQEKKFNFKKYNNDGLETWKKIQRNPILMKEKFKDTEVSSRHEILKNENSDLHGLLVLQTHNDEIGNYLKVKISNSNEPEKNLRNSLMNFMKDTMANKHLTKEKVFVDNSKEVDSSGKINILIAPSLRRKLMSTNRGTNTPILGKQETKVVEEVDVTVKKVEIEEDDSSEKTTHSTIITTTTTQEQTTTEENFSEEDDYSEEGETCPNDLISNILNKFTCVINTITSKTVGIEISPGCC